MPLPTLTPPVASPDTAPLPARSPAALVATAACLGPRTRAGAVGPEQVGPGSFLLVAADDADHAELLLPLTRTVTHVGRGLIADVRLEHQSVSRHHALVVERAGRPWLLDDNSTNGTFLNGRQVLQAPLRDGDDVRFGALTLRYREFREDRPPVDRAVLAETASAVTDGGTIAALRQEPDDGGDVWRVTVLRPDGRTVAVRLDLRLRVVEISSS